MIIRYTKFNFKKGRIRLIYCLFGIIPIYIKWEY